MVSLAVKKTFGDADNRHFHQIQIWVIWPISQILQTFPNTSCLRKHNIRNQHTSLFALLTYVSGTHDGIAIKITQGLVFQVFVLAKSWNYANSIVDFLKPRLPTLNNEHFIRIEKNLENHSDHNHLRKKRTGNEKAFATTLWHHLAITELDSTSLRLP